MQIDFIGDMCYEAFVAHSCGMPHPPYLCKQCQDNEPMPSKDEAAYNAAWISGKGPIWSAEELARTEPFTDEELAAIEKREASAWEAMQALTPEEVLEAALTPKEIADFDDWDYAICEHGIYKGLVGGFCKKCDEYEESRGGLDKCLNCGRYKFGDQLNEFQVCKRQCRNPNEE